MKIAKLGFTEFLGMAAVLILALRIFSVSESPFINDEPRLLLEVEKTHAQGTWPSVGPLGSQPIPYGPVPHWFYQGVRMVSASPYAPHLAQGAVFFLSHALMALAVWSSFGLNASAWFLVLAASSPWLFIYGKMPWEILLLTPAATLVTIASLQAQRGKWHPLLAASVWGLGMAIALGSHLMGFSIGLASFCLFLDPEWRRRGKPFLFFGCGIAITALLLSPYWAAVLGSDALGQPAKNEHWGTLKHFWWSLVKTMMYLSPWQMKYFLMPEEKDFAAYLGPMLHRFYYLDVLGWIAKVLAWGAAFSVLLGAVLPRPVSRFNFGSALFEEKFPFLAYYAAAGVLVHVLLLQFANLATYPHYFLPFWWAPFFFLAILPRREIFSYFRWLLVAGNICFIFLYVGYLRQNGGTRGDFYGSFFSNQLEITKQICASDALRVDLSGVRLRHYSVKYLALHLPDCARKELDISEEPITGKRFLARYGEGARILGEVTP